MSTIAMRRKGTTLGLLVWMGFNLFAAGEARTQQPHSAPEPAKPSATPGPTNNVRPAIKWRQFNYTCEGGAKITVYLHNTTAKVRTHDHIYMMRQTSSADGNRYSDGKLLWWGKGDTGFLQEDTPNGDGKMLVKGCALDQPAEAAKP